MWMYLHAHDPTFYWPALPIQLLFPHCNSHHCAGQAWICSHPWVQGTKQNRRKVDRNIKHTANCHTHFKLTANSVSVGNGSFLKSTHFLKSWYCGWSTKSTNVSTGKNLEDHPETNNGGIFSTSCSYVTRSTPTADSFTCSVITGMRDWRTIGCDWLPEKGCGVSVATVVGTSGSNSAPLFSDSVSLATLQCWNDDGALRLLADCLELL